MDYQACIADVDTQSSFHWSPAARHSYMLAWTDRRLQCSIAFPWLDGLGCMGEEEGGRGEEEEMAGVLVLFDG